MKEDSFREYVLDQLAELEGVRVRAMFGGHGLYLGARFFGIVYRGRLYFRTDAGTRPEYERRGMSPFRPNARQKLASYYEVPAEVVEDAVEVCDWARRAAQARRRSPRA